MMRLVQTFKPDLTLIHFERLDTESMIQEVITLKLILYKPSFSKIMNVLLKCQWLTIYTAYALTKN